MTANVVLMDIAGKQLNQLIVQHLPVVVQTRNYPEGSNYHHMLDARRSQLFNQCETWLNANFGRPFMQGIDLQSGFKRINLQGQWQRHRANSFLMTRNAALYTKLGCDLFNVMGDFITADKSVVDTLA